MRAYVLPVSLALTILVPTSANAAPRPVTAVVESAKKMAQGHRQRADFKRWLGEPGNAKIKTYYKGAMRDAEVGMALAGAGYYGAMATGFVASLTKASAMPPTLTGLAIGGAIASGAVTAAAVKAFGQAKRQAATETLKLAIELGRTPAPERVAGWTSARVIQAK
jgi:hypothetical protein